MFKDPEMMVPKEVAAMLRCSLSTAYKVMQKINKERDAQGKLVIRGRIPRQALLKKVGIV